MKHLSATPSTEALIWNIWVLHLQQKLWYETSECYTFSRNIDMKHLSIFNWNWSWNIWVLHLWYMQIYLTLKHLKVTSNRYSEKSVLRLQLIPKHLNVTSINSRFTQIIQLETSWILQIMKDILPRFDSSNYPVDPSVLNHSIFLQNIPGKIIFQYINQLTLLGQREISCKKMEEVNFKLHWYSHQKMAEKMTYSLCAFNWCCSNYTIWLQLHVIGLPKE
jgi:hypothetical protein